MDTDATVTKIIRIAETGVRHYTGMKNSLTYLPDQGRKPPVYHYYSGKIGAYMNILEALKEITDADIEGHDNAVKVNVQGGDPGRPGDQPATPTGN